MPKGVRPGGRKKGTPNKVTRDVREAIAKFAESTVEDFTDWVRSIPDPAKRCDIFLRTIEYHVPKLGRSELTGPGGGPIQFSDMSEEQIDARIAAIMENFLAMLDTANAARRSKKD
jgi:hypothetical protein